eukprot:scaffold23476_cov53-Attheya_sp.AAC.5
MNHATSLPLRLAAEPYAKQSISASCAVLGVHHHENSNETLEVAVIVDDRGVRAFCTSSPVSRRVLLECIGMPYNPYNPHTMSNCDAPPDVPSDQWRIGTLLCLVRSTQNNPMANKNEMEWFVYRAREEFPEVMAKNEMEQFSSTDDIIVHDVFAAKLLTESIRNYYAQQMLEPSVRGFLGVLEKQFAQSNLYLFELLQNAVDDGATVVTFSLEQQQQQQQGGSSLVVSHNGRTFTPLDVLGLSSVGLSTKSSGKQRTIGFMGVGFKAVYKRFSRVSIHDGTYSFRYEKPLSGAIHYGWVMQPMWVDCSTTNPTTDRTKEGTWCQFRLERPMGGLAAIQKDLAVLPVTAPPLLGRAALAKRTTGEPQTSWTLDWNGTVHTIRRTNLVSHDTTATSAGSTNGSEIVTVDIVNQVGRQQTAPKQQCWLFVSHKYTPSQAATDSYRSHTKRSHVGDEEVCGFVRLSYDSDEAGPILATPKSSLGGIVHSVLPTKLRMPVPMNVQGSWLLSVDRQEVQDFGDNEWNKDLVQRLPILIANFFRWAACERLSTPAQYKSLCHLLPSSITRDPSSQSLFANFLGQIVSLESLERVFYTECVFPVALPPQEKDQVDSMDVEGVSSSTMTGYREGQHSIWVPPSWFQFLDADFLRDWLGKRPLRSDLLGDAAFHPLFGSNHVICQLCPLPNRTQYLARAIGMGTGTGHGSVTASNIGTILCIMASIGAAHDEHPEGNLEKETGKEKKKGDVAAGNGVETKTDTSQVDAPLPAFPSSSNVWPIFLTDSGELSTLDKVVLPAADFAEAPDELRILLRPFLVSKTKGKETNVNRGGKKRNDRASRRLPTPIQKKNLHPMLEAAIYAIDSGILPESFGLEKIRNQEDVTRCAASFLSRARMESPSNVVSISDAVSNLFESFSKYSFCREEHVAAVLKITELALKTNNPSLMSHVLVDAKGGNATSVHSAMSTSIAAAREVYIGKALDESGPGADLEHFSGGSLQFLSTRYNSIAESAVQKRKLLRLFDLAGVQSGLSATISAVLDVEKGGRDLLTSEILPKLSEKKLPQTRKNPAKNVIWLPYGLGIPMDKRKYSLLDAQLAEEWEKIVRDMSPEAAVCFVSLLLAIPFDDALNVSASTTPTAAQCLAGQTDTNFEEGRKPGCSDGLGRLKTIRIANDTAIPLRRRLYYLPPGQPGAKTLDISEAEIVKQLAKWKWLPCRMPSSGLDTASALTLLRPEQAILSPDSSRPEMPVVELPYALLKRFTTSAIAKVLVWGTHAPPPPVVRLAELTEEANVLLTRERDEIDMNAISRVAAELTLTWTAIARAHLRVGGLSLVDRKKIRSICESSGGCAHCIPVRRVIDSRAVNAKWIVPVSRCIRLPEDIGVCGDDDRDTLKRVTIASFVASNFMCDFNHIRDNLFFSQSDISTAIIELANIPDLASLSPRSLITTSGAFIRFCCRTEPLIASRSSPLRSSFSYAMRWCIESPTQLPGDDVGGLKLWVRRGPGVGSKALPARWVSIKNGPVQIVLDDDKTRARYPLLTPEMGLQLLGVLDHFDSERDCPNIDILSVIDREVINFYRVLRLSDKRFSLKTRARGKPTLIDNASLKLQLVCALLKTIDVERIGDDTRASTEAAADERCGFLKPSYDPPLILRHESLTTEFRVPGMSSPSLNSLYAMWGRAPKHITSHRCVLVSGEPEDYSVELEQLVLNLVGIRSGPSLATTKAYRAALRLLSHLENDNSFEKFLRRDFAESEVTHRWRKLSKRRLVLKQLATAEEGQEPKSLRDALIKAEEVCEDDDDEGDMLLKSARELLPKLEAETKARLETEELEKAKEKELQAKREALVREGKEAFEQWKVDEKEKAISKIAGAVPMDEYGDNSNAIVGRGRGRGLTLPAWVTSGAGAPKEVMAKDEIVEPEGIGAIDLLTPAMEEAKSLVSSIMGEEGKTYIENLPVFQHARGNESHGATDTALEVIPLSGVGRGRGISNLPAWITAANVESTKPAPHLGRGVTNLPAWMTSTSVAAHDDTTTPDTTDVNQTVPKRCRPDTLVGDTKESNPIEKKSRLEAPSFQLSIKGTMERSELTQFVAWLRPKIEDRAQLHKGSAILENDPSLM